MKNTLIITAIIILMSGICYGQTNLLYFEKNSAVLTTATKKALDSMAVEIKKSNVVDEIEVIGHTDIDASKNYNKKLSLNRAINVRDYLLQKGLLNKFHINSKGKTQLVNTNGNETEKAKNRRVEVIRNYKSDNVVLDEFKQEKQQFEVDPTEDTLIVCRQGTQIRIEKNCFTTKNTTDPIFVTIQEYCTKSSFILGNLTTKDVSGKMLESRGMIYIEAVQNSKKITLKKGRSIDITFKDRKENDGTVLFNGTKQNNEIVWKQNAKTAPKNEKNGVCKYLTAYKTDVGWTDEIYYPSSEEAKYRVTATIINGFAKYDTVLLGDEEQVTNLVLKSNRLGWINCDRFYNDTMPKVNLTVEYKGDFKPYIVAVFKDINSVMSYSYIEDNKMVFANIPVNMNVKLIGIYKNKEMNKILFAEKTVKSRKDFNETITFSEINREQLKKKMEM